MGPEQLDSRFAGGSGAQDRQLIPVTKTTRRGHETPRLSRRTVREGTENFGSVSVRLLCQQLPTQQPGPETNAVALAV